MRLGSYHKVHSVDGSGEAVIRVVISSRLLSRFILNLQLPVQLNVEVKI